MLHILDRWTDYLERGGQIYAVYTEFEKAFDKVPHRRLISKLYSYGISEIVINWIRDFLTARKFRVKVNLSNSPWNLVTSGIPQGSVLGPILFLLFINDLAESCDARSEIYLFADDTKLFRHIKQDSDKQLLQNGIYDLHNWCNKWMLKLNTSKCKVISIGRNLDKSYTYDLTHNNYTISLERVDQMRDLGVLIDERLAFSNHIHKIKLIKHMQCSG